MSVIWKGATVDGLPSRGVFKSEGKYVLQTTVNGKDEWKTREIHTKGTQVVWAGEQEDRVLNCESTSMLRVTLLKKHSARADEEVGSAEASITVWSNATIATPLNPTSGGTLKGHITIRIHLSAAGPSATPGPTNAELERGIHMAAGGVSKLGGGLGVETVQTGVDMLNVGASPLEEIEDVWEPLLDGLDWFMKAMDGLAEVHQYTKTAWLLLSAAYKIVRAQQARDAQIIDLMMKIQEVYAFIREARELDDIRETPGMDKLREQALARLSAQTLECSHFISGYSRDRNFLVRLFKHSLANTEKAIGKYKDSFDATKQAFQDGSALGMELVTFRMAANLERFESKWDVQQIPYVVDAGYDGDKRCLPGTRVALLDDLMQWANVTSPEDANDPHICLVMGPAGTGKSAIAHTLASLFETTDQLGSMFCFSTSDRATRQPMALFRNLARDLCKGRPAFREALAQSVGDDMSTCGTKFLDRQFEKFILEPSQRVSVNGTILIIIDAFDESGTERERAALLKLLLKRVNELPACFRFLITCRPEPDVLRLINLPTSNVKVQTMPTVEQEATLSKDILRYVRHQLSKDMGTLPPGIDEQCCRELVVRSEGLFQWAFVACDYINGESNFGETERMRFETIQSGSDEGAGLDQLYKTVLGELFKKSKSALVPFKITMGFVLYAVEPLSRRALRQLMSLLPPEEGLRPETLSQDTILPLLGSLLSGVAKEDEPVRPLHSSFREMLCDQERGGSFYIGADDHHGRLVITCLQLLRSQLHFNMGDLRTSYVSNDEQLSEHGSYHVIQSEVVYACQHWGYHLSKCSNDLTEHFPINTLLEHLLMKNLLFWMEVGSVAGRVSALSRCLADAMDRLSIITSDLSFIAMDAIRFLRRFGNALIGSAPHIYLSALVWCPSDSRLAQLYRDPQLHEPRPTAGLTRSWPPLDFTISAHSARVASVTFSLDDTRIISGSADDTVRVWDAATGEMVGDPLVGHTGSINAIAMSRDGTRLVTGAADCTIRVWNLATGAAAGRPLKGHDKRVRSVAFSPDGTRIISGSDDCTLRVWDVRTGEVLGEPMVGHTDCVTSVAVSPDGMHIVSGSDDCTVRVWNATSGEPQGQLSIGDLVRVSSVAFSCDGTRVALGASDSTIRIWDVATKQSVGNPFMGHELAVTSVAFSRDGSRLVSGSLDKKIMVWRVATGECDGEPLMGHAELVDAVAFSHDCSRIVSGSTDGTVRVWNTVRESTGDHPLSRQMRDIRAIALLPDGSRILSGFKNNEVQTWDVATGKPTGPSQLGDQKWSVLSMAISQNGEQIASGMSNDTIHVWNTATGNLLCPEIIGHTDSITSIAFSADGSLLVSGSCDLTVRVWQVATGEPVCEPFTGHEREINSVAFSEDGTLVASGSRDGTIRVWNISRGQAECQPLIGHTGPVCSVAFSRDGKRIVSGSHKCTVRVWDVTTGLAQSDPLYGHTAPVNTVAFSPDGTRVASGSGDHSIRLWDAVTGNALGTPFVGHTNWIASVAFSRDGAWIVSSSLDNTIRVWNVTSGDMFWSSEETKPSETSRILWETATQIASLSNLSLSPFPDHQLQRPYVPSNGEQTRITMDYQSGWILGNDKDRLLWVPPDVLRTMYNGQTRAVIPGPTIYMDLSRWAHGSRWTEVHNAAA